jgi:hypothetical protein
VSDLRAVNARLRQVVADKDELIVAQSEQLSNQDERLKLQAKQVDTQADQIDTQGELLAAQAELIKRLQEEMAELRRQLAKNSSNSSTPPSKDSIAAKAKRRADRSSRVRSKDRKRAASRGIRAAVWCRRRTRTIPSESRPRSSAGTVTRIWAVPPNSAMGGR